MRLREFEPRPSICLVRASMEVSARYNSSSGSAGCENLLHASLSIEAAVTCPLFRPLSDLRMYGHSLIRKARLNELAVCGN